MRQVNFVTAHVMFCRTCCWVGWDAQGVRGNVRVGGDTLGCAGKLRVADLPLARGLGHAEIAKFGRLTMLQI
jgi:hypothetical protein